MAIIPSKIGGMVAFAIDGISYNVSGQCTYRPSTVERTSKVGQSGIAGYKEMPMVGRISAKIFDAAELNVGLLNLLTNVTVTVQLANGKGVTGAGMWQVEATDVDTEEGEFDIAFEGPLVEEFSI